MHPKADDISLLLVIQPVERNWIICVSRKRDATIYDDALACDEGTGGGGQEHQKTHQVFRRLNPFYGLGVHNTRHKLVCTPDVGYLCLSKPWHDGIDPNIMRSKLLGHDPGHSGYGSLGGHVVHKEG